MKNREERVLHGEVKPEVAAKASIEVDQVVEEEEPEVFYDRVINLLHFLYLYLTKCNHAVQPRGFPRKIKVER